MVEGDFKIEREYYDPKTNAKIVVNMSIKDHLFFDFLKQLIAANRLKVKR